MASTTSSLIVRLIDQVSGPARGVSRSLDRMQAGIRGASARNAAALGAMRGKLVDAVVVTTALATAMSKPIRAAAEFQSKILDIGQKAGMTQKDMDALRSTMLGLSGQFGKSATEMAESFDNLIGKGLSAEATAKIIGPVAKVATAYRASMDDIASAGFAVMSNMNVPADQITKAYEAMAEAGKRGAFELKDMAAELPGLTGIASTKGLSGTKGVAQLSAALQIGRKLAPTGGEAATNIGDLLGKIDAPTAVQKFQKAGINIRKELAKGLANGDDVFVTIANVLNRATKGNQNLVGDFLQDKQARLGALALLQNIKEYKEIRDAANNATGNIDKDFAERQKTAAASMERFTASMERMGIAIGTALLEPMQRFLAYLEPIIAKVTEFAQANPQLVATLGQIAAALVGVNVALLAFRYAGLLMGGQILALASGIVTLIRPIELVKTALSSLKLALISTGIGAILVGIALAGTWIYNNWSGVSTAFKSFADTIANRFPGLGPTIQKVGEWIGQLFDVLGNLTGKVDASTEAWAAFGTAMANKVADAVQYIIDLPGKILSVIQALPGQMQAAGAAAIDALWQGMLGAFDRLIAGVRGKVAEAASAIGSLGGLVGGAQPAGIPPAGTAPNRATATSPPGRFGGGPVTKGRPYTVGERGRETFWPSQSGRIVPNGGGGGRINVGSINIHGVQDPGAIADQVVAEISARVDKKFRGGQADMGLGFV